MTDHVAAINARIAGIENRIAQLGRTTSTIQPLGAINGEFGQVLESTQQTSVALTPAERRSPGSFGPLSAPAELVSYGNGTIPAEALQQLQSHPTHSLWAPAAQAFDQMVSAASAEGVTIDITDSYRPLRV